MKANFEYVNSVLSIECININISWTKIDLTLDKIYSNICKFIETICSENNISCRVAYTEQYVCLTINYTLLADFKIRIKPKTANVDKYSLAISDFNNKLDYINRYKYTAWTKLKSLNSKLIYLKKKLSLIEYPISTVVGYEIDNVKSSITTKKRIINTLDNEINNLIAKGIIVD